MVGAGPRALTILSVALGAGCAARHAGPSAPAVATASTPALAGPVYRFVSEGVTSATSQRALDAGAIGVISARGLGREIVRPDGSVEQAPMLARDPLMTSLPVPATLGGGYLFWNADALYRARSFLAPLEAVVALPTNVVGVEVGPSSVLVFLEGAPPRAFALDPPRQVPLSPHGVLDVASAGDGRALALDAAGRALASTDAGKSWREVTAALGAPVEGVREEGNEVAFTLSRSNGAWLQKDGQFVQRAFAPAPRATPEEKAAQLWRWAVAGGLPLPGGRALAGQGRGTVVVDLQSGSASAAKPAGPEGSSCRPISLDEEGLLVCFAYAPQQTVTVVSHALGATPRIERTFQGTPHVLPGRTPSVMARCAGAPAEGTACVRQPGGVWVEVSLSPELLKTWWPLFWLPRDSGGVAVIASEREARAPKVALIEPATGTVTPWDAAIDQVTPSGLPWRPGSGLRVLADGTVRGFTTTGTITVDAKGHVSPGARKFASITSADEHALARDDAERLWQTSDSGARWVEIAPPPFDSLPEGVEAMLNPRPSGRAGRIDCSPVGCVIEHSSGVGNWLRVGWPEDPPRVAGSAVPSRSVASEKAGPIGAAPPILSLPLPRLHCVTRSGQPLLAKAPPKVAAPGAPGVEWVEIFAGQRTLARRGARVYANIPFREFSSLEQPLGHYGLRAAVHLEASEDTPFEALVRQRAPFEARFVEPFDPSGRLRQISSSLAAWATAISAKKKGASPLERRARAEPFDLSEGSARPVLSAKPGHAGGLLLVDGGLSFFASSAGQVRPLPPGCSPASGFVDQAGKLLLACTERNGATDVTEVPGGQVRLHVPTDAHFRDGSRAGMSFFPPGLSPFVNPDAIAVGPEGKLRILHLPPGDEPPTADNPAWLLSGGADAPVELGPWSTLEPATSPACARGDGYRALVQTSKSWLSTDGSASFPPESGMTALVRWSPERVCLEAVEVGFVAPAQVPESSRPLGGLAVARLLGDGAGAAFVGTEGAASMREPALCELGAGAASKP